MTSIHFITAAGIALISMSSHGQSCPPAGAKFQRNNAGMISTMTSTGQPAGSGWCYYRTESNRPPAYSRLQSTDEPLDAVPKQSGGVCPVGQLAQYKIVLTTYNDSIVAGPDSAGRCQVRTAQGRLQWLYTNEFQLVAATNAAPKSFGALPVGSVWTCTLPGIGMFTGAYFGIVDGSTYRNYDGKTGRYSFDAASGLLKMTSGSSKGMSYLRQSEKDFRVLDDKGNMTGGNCVWVKEKSIQGKW